MREVRFEVEGESVAGSLCEPEGPVRGNLVLVHGLLSQRVEFGEAGARLAKRGFRTLTIDQRGFGASGGERGVFSQERSTADTLAAFDFLAKTCGEAPEGVVGHSMGAVFSLRALSARPSIRAGVIVAPMRTVRSEISDVEFAGYRLAYAVSRAKSRLGLGPLLVPYKNRYRDLFVDEAARKGAEEVAFLFSHVNMANYPDLVAMDAEEEARRVHQPVLVILAAHDKAVRHESSMAVYHALGGHKEVATVDSGHSVWTDRARDVVLEHVDGFLRSRLA